MKTNKLKIEDTDGDCDAVIIRDNNYKGNYRIVFLNDYLNESIKNKDFGFPEFGYLSDLACFALDLLRKEGRGVEDQDIADKVFELESERLIELFKK